MSSTFRANGSAGSAAQNMSRGSPHASTGSARAPSGPPAVPMGKPTPSLISGPAQRAAVSHPSPTGSSGGSSPAPPSLPANTSGGGTMGSRALPPKGYASPSPPYSHRSSPGAPYPASPLHPLGRSVSLPYSSSASLPYGRGAPQSAAVASGSVAPRPVPGGTGRATGPVAPPGSAPPSYRSVGGAEERSGVSPYARAGTGSSAPSVAVGMKRKRELDAKVKNAKRVCPPASTHGPPPYSNSAPMTGGSPASPSSFSAGSSSSPSSSLRSMYGSQVRGVMTPQHEDLVLAFSSSLPPSVKQHNPLLTRYHRKLAIRSIKRQHAAAGAPQRIGSRPLDLDQRIRSLVSGFRKGSQQLFTVYSSEEIEAFLHSIQGPELPVQGRTPQASRSPKPTAAAAPPLTPIAPLPSSTHVDGNVSKHVQRGDRVEVDSARGTTGGAASYGDRSSVSLSAVDSGMRGSSSSSARGIGASVTSRQLTSSAQVRGRASSTIPHPALPRPPPFTSAASTSFASAGPGAYLPRRDAPCGCPPGYAHVCSTAAPPPVPKPPPTNSRYAASMQRGYSAQSKLAAAQQAPPPVPLPASFRVASFSANVRREEPQNVSLAKILSGEVSMRAKLTHSPLTHRALPHFIWRDYHCIPAKAQVLMELRAVLRRREAVKDAVKEVVKVTEGAVKDAVKEVAKEAEDGIDGLKIAPVLQAVSWADEETVPIDYCYIEPLHVEQVNRLFATLFWPEVDVTEALKYPELSVVALYKQLVVGCALMTVSGYITYLGVHPDWQRAGIGSFMLYHMVNAIPNRDVTMHAPAHENHSLELPRRFGFKPEQYIVDFYKPLIRGARNPGVEWRDAVLLRLQHS